MLRFLAVFVLIATPVLAADKAADDGLVKGGPPGTNVEMPYLMAPMDNADGKLSGYAYLSTRLTAGSPAAALQVRDKLAFIQDVFVRDINSTSVTSNDDPTKVDIAAVETRLANDARKIVGAANVKMVTICTVQIADLNPKNTQDPNDPGGPGAQSRCEPEKGGG